MSNYLYLESFQELLGLSNNPSYVELRSLIQNGIPFSIFIAVQNELDLPHKKLLEMLGISAQTLARRKKENHLNAFESDRLFRIIRIFSAMVEVLGSKEKARIWLKTPNTGLGGDIPIELLSTDIGANQVEDILHRIEYGIYS